MSLIDFGQQITRMTDSELLETLKKGNALNPDKIKLLKMEVERRDILKRWTGLPSASRRAWIAIIVSGVSVIVSVLVAIFK